MLLRLPSSANCAVLLVATNVIVSGPSLLQQSPVDCRLLFVIVVTVVDVAFYYHFASIICWSLVGLL